MNPAQPADLPKLIFLFGLSGAGKNYVGNLFHRWGGYFFYDADIDMPADMTEAVSRGEPFHETQRDRYFEIIRVQIAKLQAAHSLLVVAQAAYKKRHRQMLAEAFPEMKFVQIIAPWECIDRRLIEQAGSITPAYARRIAENFEAPEVETLQIFNDKDDVYVLSQLDALFPRNS